MAKRKRIVVKIGSSSLTHQDGGLDRQKLLKHVGEIARLKADGHQVVLVSSGAVAAGFKLLGFPARPKHIPEKQAAAAVGQGVLIEEYGKAFAQYGYTVAQLLLVRKDFKTRDRYLHAFNALSILLERGVIPIINENDSVVVDELTFGDNDMLSALVAGLVKADLLVILTDIDALYNKDPRKYKDAEPIYHIRDISEEIERMAQGAGSALGTGGMRSKIEAAKVAIHSGVPVFLGNGQKPGILQDAINRHREGTYFATEKTSLAARKHWLAFHSESRGRLIVDNGAKQALCHAGKSLLASGVRSVEGDFQPGDVVSVCDDQGRVFAKGIVNYTAKELDQVKGCDSHQIVRRHGQPVEVINRDYLTIIVGV
jgi:glutamate 5-kinase